MAETTVERRRWDLEDWWRDLFGRRFFDWLDVPLPTLRDGERMLRVEEFVDGRELVIRAELPDIDPDKDVSIHVRDHELEIRAERKERSERKEKGLYRSEFRYGSFFRAVTLPPDAKRSDVHASYKDGILEVRVPLDVKQAEATKIEVTRS